MDPVALFAFFFRYRFKTLPEIAGTLGLIAAIIWGIAEYCDLSVIGQKYFRFSPATILSVSAVLIAVGSWAAWQGYNLQRNGWPLNWVWGSFINGNYDEKTGLLRIWGFEGLVENASNTEVQLDEAYIVLGMNGRRLPIKMNNRYGKYLDPKDFYPLPKDSQRVDVRAIFNSETEPLTENDYWLKVGTIQFNAKYAGRSYSKEFSRLEISRQFESMRPALEAPYPASRMQKGD